MKKLGLKTAVATTTPKFLFMDGIQDFAYIIDFVCTGYEAGCEKSNPQIFREICRVLEVQPSSVLVIGDSYELDIRNPNQLGMKTIHITKQKGNTVADYSVKNIAKAVEIVEKMMK